MRALTCELLHTQCLILCYLWTVKYNEGENIGLVAAEKTRRSGWFGKNTAPILNDMKYRGVEYTVVQGIGRHVWKWSVSLDTGVSVGGRTAIKSEAVAEAERAIDRALAPKKLRLVQPKTER